MKDGWKILGVVALGAVILASGVAIGWMTRSPSGLQQGAYVGPGWMMGGSQQTPYSGMMGGYGGMMGGSGMMGYGGAGMMGGYVPDDSLIPKTGERLTLDQATSVVEAYLSAYGDDNLKLVEVMQFDNHFYAEIEEKDTGIHAFELLVDPLTATVYPEPGPNMMWNIRYGMMAGGGYMGRRGMMGSTGMMGGLATAGSGTEMPVTPDKAVGLAQEALNTLLPGTPAADEADAFYGYYTMHVLRDGKVSGMLSVNGYSGEVWLHTWHGGFVDTTEESQ